MSAPDFNYNQILIHLLASGGDSRYAICGGKIFAMNRGDFGYTGQILYYTSDLFNWFASSQMSGSIDAFLDLTTDGTKIYICGTFNAVHTWTEEEGWLAWRGIPFYTGGYESITYFNGHIYTANFYGFFDMTDSVQLFSFPYEIQSIKIFNTPSNMYACGTRISNPDIGYFAKWNSLTSEFVETDYVGRGVGGYTTTGEIVYFYAPDGSGNTILYMYNGVTSTLGSIPGNINSIYLDNDYGILYVGVGTDLYIWNFDLSIFVKVGISDVNASPSNKFLDVLLGRSWMVMVQSDFSASPRVGFHPLHVDFLHIVSNPLGFSLDYYWDFGDGGHSADENPSHDYYNSGKFNVMLRVRYVELLKNRYINVLAPSVFVDCLLGSVVDVDNGNFVRCAMADTPQIGGLVDECQVGWTQPTVPQWDGDKQGFYNSILSLGTESPPQPGIAPYVGYEKGLWGSNRIGIGAVYFNKQSTFIDCLLGSTANVDDGIFKNSAMSVAPLVRPTLTNCQVGWIQPPPPIWDGSRSNFSNSILAVGTLTPTQPGNPPYTEYEQGLWNSVRIGIGAVDFTVLPTIKMYLTQRTKRHIIKSLDSSIIPAIYDGHEFGVYQTPGTTDSMLNYPNGITIDGDNNIYVCDTVNNRIVKLNSTLNFVSKYSTISTIGNPVVIMYDDNNNSLYVVGVFFTSNYAYQIRIEKLSTSLSSLKVSGNLNNPGDVIHYPTGICLGFDANSILISGVNLALYQTVESDNSFSLFVRKNIICDVGESQVLYKGIVSDEGFLYLNDGKSVIKVNSSFERIGRTNFITKTLIGLKLSELDETLMLYDADKQKIVKYDTNLNFVNIVYSNTDGTIGTDAYDVEDIAETNTL